MRRTSGAAAGGVVATGAAGIALLLALVGSPAQAASASFDFDHSRSGFPLLGAHARVSCESCHAGGLFEGTPRECGSCHASQGARALSGKPPDHIPSSNTCSDCHSAMGWAPARFDHELAVGSCGGCHDGVRSAGKPAGHLRTSAGCEECHSSAAWSPARFDHAQVTGACATCHDGARATGRTPNHLPTASTCEDCHTTAAWSPARFDHSGVTGSCATCHDGVRASGKPGNHFLTTADCSECHRSTAWTPSTFQHGSPFYPSGHRAVDSCQSCHVANSEQSAWQMPGYKPDCAGCHALDFKPEPHRKVDSPRVLYTVSELRDCAGSCHVYTDPTLSQIKERRSGEHSAARGGF